MKKQYMGIDQHGQTYLFLTHPRKDLQKRLPGKIRKMYVDPGFHVGYAVGNLWVRVYELRPFKESI